MTTALALGVVVLPFWANGLRYTAHEPHREGLIALLGAVALVSIGRQGVRRAAWPLLVALGLWAGSWILSAGLALSPAVALAGTSYRADGLGLLVGLLGAVALGWGADVRVVGRWLWGAGLAVSVVVLAQWGGLLPMDVSGTVARPAGTFGLPPFAAGWLALVLPWAALARPTQGRWRGAYWGGLALMVFALVLTGTRGAVLALAGAVGVAVLLDRRGWRTGLGVLAAVIVVAGGGLAVHQVQPIPLIDRLDERAADYSNRFRARLWTNTLAIARFEAPVLDADLNPDPLQAWRAAVGYGPGHLERLHRPYAYADRYFRDRYAENQVIDRAHNDWLDVLVVQGWLGVGARLGLWLAVYTVALRRLRVFRPVVLVWPVGLGVAGCALAWGTPWVALAGTAGLLLGMALGLAWRPRPPAPDLPGRLALLLLPVHIIDLQFSFVVVANTWPFWLMLGTLLATAARPLAVRDGRWAAAVAGFLLVREFTGVLPVWAGHPVADVGLVVGLLLAASASVTDPRRVVVWAVVFVVGGWCAYDTLADIRYQRDGVTVAAALRPWDASLQAQAALSQLSRAAQDDTVPLAVPSLARLAWLNRYEPDLAYGRGWWAQLAGATSGVRHLHAAHTLVPANPIYCAQIPNLCEF